MNSYHDQAIIAYERETRLRQEAENHRQLQRSETQPARNLIQRTRSVTGDLLIAAGTWIKLPEERTIAADAKLSPGMAHHPRNS